MRYIKVLILACFIFLSLVFFFQNQTPLSTKMELSLDLFFIPPMKSITLPFYFLLVCAFFAGVLMSILMLVWDRLHLSARLLKDKWQIKSLSNKLQKAESLLSNVERPSFFAKVRKFFSVDEARPVVQNKDVLARTTNTVSKSIDAVVGAKEDTPVVPQGSAKPAA